MINWLKKRFTLLFYTTLVLIGLLSFLLPWMKDQQFRDGLVAAKGGNYDIAITEWRPLADDGYAPAQFNLGVLYDRGLGVRIDATSAANWYRQAAEQDVTDAQINLGLMLIEGRGVEKNPTEAFGLFTQAAEKNSPEAQNNLGNLYLKGLGTERDRKAAVMWFERAARQGHALAQYNLGERHLYGQGTKLDPLEAYAWFSQAPKDDPTLAESSQKRLFALARAMLPKRLEQAKQRVAALKIELQGNAQ